jgi:hypothetical protein
MWFRKLGTEKQQPPKMMAGMFSLQGGLLVLIFGIVIECFGAIDSIHQRARPRLSCFPDSLCCVAIFAPPPPLLSARAYQNPSRRHHNAQNSVFTAG